MKRILAVFVLVFGLQLGYSQTFSSSKASKCQVQVAYAISEADGFGEYSITNLIPLNPGESFDFRYEEFRNRRIYGNVEFEQMFIVRFEPTGVTHYLDASVPHGYETFLNGGCSIGQQPFYTRDGEFHIDASQN